MGKVHPLTVRRLTPINEEEACSSSSTTTYMTSKRETFTVWMKSLVMQGNGCTAFDENGEIVYRIDNYDNKRSSEVYLMDLRGKTLFTLSHQKLCISSTWQGYKSNINAAAASEPNPMFRVTKSCRSILGNIGSSSYKVSMRSADHNMVGCYRLEALSCKSSAFKIIDSEGRVVAEAKRKQSCSGVVLGDDVLSLVVEAHVDHSFIMALVTVFGLIRHQI